MTMIQARNLWRNSLMMIGSPISPASCASDFSLPFDVEFYHRWCMCINNRGRMRTWKERCCKILEGAYLKLWDNFRSRKLNTESLIANQSSPTQSNGSSEPSSLNTKSNSPDPPSLPIHDGNIQLTASPLPNVVTQSLHVPIPTTPAGFLYPRPPLQPVHFPGTGGCTTVS